MGECFHSFFRVLPNFPESAIVLEKYLTFSGLNLVKISLILSGYRDKHTVVHAFF